MRYIERARALRPYIEKASISLPDEDALQAEGNHYISLIDGNVFSPAEYPAGWQEQA